MKVFLAFSVFFLAACLPLSLLAQTTEFTYQGELTDNGSPQASYQMRFRLFGALAGGSQIGNTVENTAVAVNDGIFTVSLNFGSAVFTGADRYLEIAVRRNGGESYTVLNPRQKIASSPYAIRTLSAQTADVALDSQKLGGIDANQYLTNASVGSAFVRNDTVQQTANYNVTGTGVVGTALGVGGAVPGGGYDLNVDGAVQFTPGGAGGALQFGTPSGETGVAIVGTNRADIRFDGSVLKLLAGAGTGTPSSLNGLGISTTGLIGAGTAPNGNFRIDSQGSMRAYSSASAHFVAETTGGTNAWARYYMRSPNRSWFLGTSQNFNGDQLYIVDETGGQTRMTVSTSGYVGINNSNPQTGLDMRGTGFQIQQRITDNTSGNSLVLQAGSDSNMKITGYNYGGATAVPLYLSTDGANTVMNSGGGHVMQPGAGYGLARALVFINGDGTIKRCYNGNTGTTVTNGTTTSGCGFVVTKSGSGLYYVNLGFAVSSRFFVATPESGCCGSDEAVSNSFDIWDSTTLRLWVYQLDDPTSVRTDRPVMLMVF